jgi:hypothetical protein
MCFLKIILEMFTGNVVLYNKDVILYVMLSKEEKVLRGIVGTKNV